jgi:hypothetical protein
MSAVMAVMLRREEILDPDGYVDLDKLLWVRDVVLPLETRIDKLTEGIRDLDRLCRAMAQCVLDVHGTVCGSEIVETLGVAEAIREVSKLAERPRPDLRVVPDDPSNAG